MTTSQQKQADAGYYAAQTQNVNDQLAMGLQENTNASEGADLTYQQKLDNLTQKLQQQQNTLGDKYGARGVISSGIFNYGSNAPMYTGARGGGQNSMAGPGNAGWWTGTQGGTGAGGQMGAMQQFAFDEGSQVSQLKAQQANVDQGYQIRAGTLQHTANDQIRNINATQAQDAANQAAADAVAAGG